MKRVLAFILIWTFLVVTGTIVSANSQTRRSTTSSSSLTNQVNSAGLREQIRTTTEAN